MLLTLKGTAYLYQGDELGMTNYPFKSIDEYDDIEARNAWTADVLTGRESAEHYLGNLAKVSRDHARTPMQWSGAAHAGFTTAEARPWLAVNPNYTTINVEAEEKDPASVLSYTRRLLAFRRQSIAWIYGSYEDLLPEHPQLFVYARVLGTERFVVALNVSGERVALPGVARGGQVVLGNVDARVDEALEPWEARITQWGEATRAE
jgi:oligo-1,6-glucosidase